MSLWQTHNWQKMLASSGQIEQFFAVGGVFVEKRQVSLGEFGLFVVGVNTSQISQNLTQELQTLCKKELCLFVQIETLDYIALERYLSFTSEMVAGKYYKKFIPPYTALIDLSQTEDQILALMKPKGRYNIRLAEKKGVVVEQVEKHNYNIKVFFELMQETTRRDSFAGNSLHYYETFLSEISDSQLFFAYFESRVIAAGIFVSSDDAMLYYYGASGSEYRNLMAPYLLQWSAITHAKKRGLKLYDFLGVMSPGDLSSSLAGVTDFKLKFTSDVRKVSESYIWVNKKWKWYIVIFLRKILKR